MMANSLSYAQVKLDAPKYKVGDLLIKSGDQKNSSVAFAVLGVVLLALPVKELNLQKPLRYTGYACLGTSLYFNLSANGQLIRAGKAMKKE